MPAWSPQAYASYVAATPSDVLLASLKAGATEKFNGDLSNNWQRLQCTPTDAAPRVVCKNQYSGDYAVVFDADCGAAGQATIEVCGPGWPSSWAVLLAGPLAAGNRQPSRAALAGPLAAGNMRADGAMQPCGWLGVRGMGGMGRQQNY